ncbi:MAG: endonuclease/exonuclease/phosphatase family protein [Cyanobacteria bacterium J06635_15]
MAEKSSSKSCLGLGLSVLILGAIAVITLFSYGTSRYGWKIYLEIFSHFQVQYFLLSLILILLRRRFLILLGFFFCALLSAQILPWYLPPAQLSSGARLESDLRVLIANVNTQNKSYDKVINLVRSETPDLAIFMEVDDAWKSQLDTLGDLLPHSSGQTNPYNLGILVYSNLELGNPKIEFFGTENNASVVTQITVAEQSVNLLATHPLPPAKSSFFQAHNRQLDLVSQYIETLEGPVILAGDLNTTMWSPYYKRLANKTRLNNARDDFGILPTWPTKGTYHRIPGWLTSLFLIPIDHCLISSELDATNIYTGADTGSDHRPLIVDLRFVS